MDLKQIKGIGPAKQEKLKAAGVTTVEALARADVAAVCAKAGLDEQLVRELKQRALAHTLVEDLKSFGPATLETLGQAGAESLKEFYAASSEWTEAQMQLLQSRYAGLRDQAEALAAHVREQARTAEGRQALAV